MSEIAVYQPRGEVATREPHRDIDSWIQVVSDVIKIANVICDTPFVPDGLRGSAPAVAAAILSGREMGLGMMTSLANIDVIRGKPTQKPLLMRAMILERGHKWVDVDVTDTRAVVRGCRRGESEWTEVTFTADQARKAGLDLGKYPADKLYARASSRLAKRRFADVIMGMPYTPDDVEDGVDDDEAGTVTETTAPAPKVDKPRTAQRRQRIPSTLEQAPEPASPAPAAPPADSSLPPLPGEDEPPLPPVNLLQNGLPDPSPVPGSEPATNKQLTAIWTALTQDYAFSDDEKDMARAACGSISGRGPDLASTKDLTKQDAGTVLDTLAHLKQQAADTGEHPRSLLIALLAEREDGEARGE